VPSSYVTSAKVPSSYVASKKKPKVSTKPTATPVSASTRLANRTGPYSHITTPGRRKPESIFGSRENLAARLEGRAASSPGLRIGDVPPSYSAQGPGSEGLPAPGLRRLRSRPATIGSESLVDGMYSPYVDASSLEAPINVMDEWANRDLPSTSYNLGGVPEKRPPFVGPPDPPWMAEQRTAEMIRSSSSPREVHGDPPLLPSRYWDEARPSGPILPSRYWDRAEEPTTPWPSQHFDLKALFRARNKAEQKALDEEGRAASARALGVNPYRPYRTPRTHFAPGKKGAGGGAY
jgi:hypothetical protein